MSKNAKRGRNGSERMEKVLLFCRTFIAEHGRGPKLLEIAEGTGVPEGGVAQTIGRLRQEGRIACEVGSYTNMRVVDPPPSAPALVSEVRGLLPPGARELLAVTIGGLWPAAVADDLRARLKDLHANLLAKVKAVETVMSLVPEAS